MMGSCACKIEMFMHDVPFGSINLPFETVVKAVTVVIAVEIALMKAGMLLSIVRLLVVMLGVVMLAV